MSRRIARAIVRSRPIRSTAHLADVVSVAARPMNQAERRIHPATRTFQALRIVKAALRDGVKQGHYTLLTKKPVTANDEEIDRNPRSRSAKLRAAEKV